MTPAPDSRQLNRCTPIKTHIPQLKNCQLLLWRKMSSRSKAGKCFRKRRITITLVYCTWFDSKNYIKHKTAFCRKILIAIFIRCRKSRLEKTYGYFRNLFTKNNSRFWHGFHFTNRGYNFQIQIFENGRKVQNIFNFLKNGTLWVDSFL